MLRPSRCTVGDFFVPMVLTTMQQSIAAATGRDVRAVASPARVVDWLRSQVLAERARWALWLPVALGAGIGGYFALPTEPPVWLGTASVAFALLVSVAGRLRTEVLMPALVLAVVSGGFAAAQLRTQIVAAPILAEEHGPAAVVGQVLAVEPRERGDRLLLARPEVEGLPVRLTPERARVAVAAGAPDIRAGDRVRLRAVLRPPPEPAAPGAFDFARRAYFERLGAVGFALGQVERLRSAPVRGWEIWWTQLRGAIAVRVRETIGGSGGAVAAALMAGERGAIPDEVMAAMRDAGLAHLLAISGLHVGLVAGLVFFAMRTVLALVPYVALRWAIKKWAALAAALAAGAYLFLVGATIPTQRAFLMVSMMLLATALDRTAITMRLVAWAAVAVLLLQPESLTNVSFQMSFAATMGLVACYESLRARGWTFAGERGLPRRVALYFAGVALTSVVAIAATAPFAIYHFNRVALYGLAANLIAVPLTAVVIMPLALTAFVLMPLGVERPVLVAMGWGIDAVVAAAKTVADWPGAIATLPSPPTAGLLAVILGTLWLCIWMRPWRWFGLLPIALGIATLLFARTPDILISADARLMAVRGADGGLWLSSGRRARFTADVWMRRAGQGDVRTFPGDGEAAPAARLRCDPLGCIQKREDHVVALVRDGRALVEDCRKATVLVSTIPVARSDCAGPLVLIDRFDLWRNGSHAVTFDSGDVRVETVRERRGQRPWVRVRGGG